MGNDKNERASAKKRPPRKSAFAMTWVTFLEHDIASAYFAPDQDAKDALEHLFVAAESGWKFSLSYSESYEGYIASITNRDKDSNYYQRCFLVSHVDGVKAIRAIAYVLHTMLPRGDFLNDNNLKAATW